MPLKPHPTDPDKMVYTKTEYGNISVGKEWVGLTDEEAKQVLFDLKIKTMGVIRTEDVVRAIEAKLKEKNNG